MAGVLGEVPSLYVQGALVGNLATISHLDSTNELEKLLPAGSIVESLEARLKRIINQHHIMLFMKGSP